MGCQALNVEILDKDHFILRLLIKFVVTGFKLSSFGVVPIKTLRG